MPMRLTTQIGLVAAVVLTAGCEQFGGSSSPIAQVGERWEMVDKYCTDCHNGLELAGNVAFDEFGPEVGNRRFFPQPDSIPEPCRGDQWR
jgi:hypothetical protein